MTTPTLFQWLGGMPALLKLTDTFYARVPQDPVLAPVFARMSREHPQHVAEFLAEVLGGPATYSEARGGHAEMIRHHLGRSLTQVQRRRWVELLLCCADELGVPDDPEFRSAFVAYLEWGTRLAVINSQPGVEATPQAPMPKWGWGEARGPYDPAAATPQALETTTAAQASAAPAGWRSVTPRIVVEDVPGLVKFVKHVFAATGEARDEAPAELRIGDCVVMISGTAARPPTPAFLYVYVADVDACFERAVAAGARVLEAPRGLPYGDRRCMLEDGWNNVWQIATRRQTAAS